MLEAVDIAVDFGGVRAVDDVSFRVEHGELLGLVGPNGSGKTSLLNAVTGTVPTHSGRLLIDGEHASLGDPRRIRRAGILRTFQVPQTFLRLTCVENVLLSMDDRRGSGLLSAWLARWRMWRGERERAAKAVEALASVGLEDLAPMPAHGLAYGQQRLLGLARSIAAEPRILLLDEPSAGLNDRESEHLAGILLSLRAQGMALVVVDHKIDFLNSICDRLMALQLGRVIATGQPDAVWRDSQVVEAYLGRTRA